jgi:hypothetical protein
MLTSEVLRAARELVATPERWIKGHYAGYRNPVSLRVTCLSPGDVRSANCFCATGALLHLDGLRDDAYKAASAALEQSLPRTPTGLGRWNLERYNDLRQTTHADILALYDRAITEAMHQEQNAAHVEEEAR